MLTNEMQLNKIRIYTLFVHKSMYIRNIYTYTRTIIFIMYYFMYILCVCIYQILNLTKI